VLLFTPLGARLATTLEPVSTKADEGLLDQLEPDASTRVDIYRIALKMVEDRPLLGYGPDNFATGVPKFRPEPAPLALRQTIATSAHSWVAATATNSGLVGLAAYIAIIMTALVLLSRAPRTAIGTGGAVITAAYLGTGLTTVNALETDALLWIGIASMVIGTVGWAPAVSLSHVGARTVKRTRSERSTSVAVSAFGWVAVLVGVIVSLTTIPALDASRSAKMSADARLVGKVGDAISLATHAVGSDPNRADYWHVLGLAYVGAGRWSDATVSFQSAARLAPYDIRFLTDDIQVQLILSNLGDSRTVARANDLADRAVAMDPRNPQAHLARAVVSQVRGDLTGAVASAHRALALDPGSTNSQLYVTATQVLIASMQFDDGVDTARLGLTRLGSTPESVPLRLELARALALGGRSDDAIREIDAALGLAPGNEALLRLRAQILASK
jgi:cytochrome c-type biogenesis protein CcmH/NrfG